MPNTKLRTYRRTCVRCGNVFRFNSSLEGMPGEIDYQDDETIHFTLITKGDYLATGVSVVVPAATVEDMINGKVCRENRCITCDEEVIDDIHGRLDVDEMDSEED